MPFEKWIFRNGQQVRDEDRRIAVAPIESLHLGQIEVRIFIHIQFGKLIQKKTHFDLH